MVALKVSIQSLSAEYGINFGPLFNAAIAAVVGATSDVVLCQGVVDNASGLSSNVAADDSTSSTVRFSLQSVGVYDANVLGAILTSAMQNQSSSFYLAGTIISNNIARVTCNGQSLVATACPSSSSGLSSGAIAGIVIGVIIGLILLCLAFYCVISRSRKGGISESGSAAPSGSQGYTQEGSEFRAPEESTSRQVEMVNYAKEEESKVQEPEGGELDTTEDNTTNDDEGEDGETTML